MTAPVNRPRRKPGPKPNPIPAKMVRIPGELLPIVEELKKLVRQLRLAAQEMAEAESEARGIFEQRARESQADPPHGVFIRPGNEEAQRSNHAGLFSLSELSTGRHIH